LFKNQSLDAVIAQQGFFVIIVYCADSPRLLRISPNWHGLLK
jgi:hypothetical protein